MEFASSYRPAYNEVVRVLREEIGLGPPGGRPEKRPESVVAKLQREQIELARMQDIAGCRVLVDGLTEQDAVVAKLVAQFPGARVRDRRAAPSHSYRAVHVIVSVNTPAIGARPVEVQIRTYLQHYWASLSEHFADRYGASFKYGGSPTGSEALRPMLDRTARLVAELEEREQTRGALLAPDLVDRRVRWGQLTAMLELADLFEDR